MSTPLFKAAEEFGARSMTAFTMGSSMTRREPSTRRQFSTTLPAVVWSRHGPRCGVLAGRRRAADDEARARRHRGIRLGCVLGTAVRDVVSVPGRRCRSERGCRCLRQDAGRGRQRGRAAGTDPCGVTEGTSACPGHRAGEPRPAQLAGCRSTARARTSATSRARSAPYTYWASVPSTAGPYRSRRVGSHRTSRSTTPASSLRCSSSRWRLARRHSWWQRGSGSADRDGGEP